MTAPASPSWNPLLLDQLQLHWQHQLRPRLQGLTDEEYLWEPAADCWSIRPRGECRSPAPIGTGAFQRDDAPDDPDPAPVTTMLRPCGPAEGHFSEHPMAALVVHIHRELIHHGAEVSLLRDLYARRAADGAS